MNVAVDDLLRHGIGAGCLALIFLIFLILEARITWLLAFLLAWNLL